MGLIASWLTLAFALWVADKALEGMEIKGGLTSYVIVAGIFGTLHFFVGWFFTFVLMIASLGLTLLFSFVAKVLVSAIILKLADAVSGRLRVDGFGVAIVAALLMSVVNTAVQWLL